MTLKKKKQILVAVLVLSIVGMAACGGWYWYDTHVDRSGWFQSGEQMCYRDFHGKPVTGPLELDGKQYFFDPGGVPHIGFLELDGKTYYYDPQGVRITGWLEIAGGSRYFGPNGAMVTGWLWLGEDHYYFNAQGLMVTGWQYVDGKRSFFLDSGVLARGLLEVGGETLCFGEDGTYYTGFYDREDSRCYFLEGKLHTGPLEVDGKRYWFLEDGTMVTGWIDLVEGLQYYTEDGSLAVGWQDIDGLRYYFTDMGTLTSGWLQEGEYTYYLRSDGTAATGRQYIEGHTHYFSPLGMEVYLVNAVNQVPSYFKRQLIELKPNHQVDIRCYDALVKMLDDLVAAGLNCEFNSGYRTMEVQTAILETRTEEYREQYGVSASEARVMALETVAIPGTSEHQLGLAVDLLGNEAGVWLREHCWDYGFIVRYTADKEWATGIVDEPWHFRYVGKEVAQDIRTSGLCLEEYLGAQYIDYDTKMAAAADYLIEEPTAPEIWPAEPTPTEPVETVPPEIQPPETQPPETQPPETRDPAALDG